MKRIIPVIHLVNTKQLLRNIDTCLNNNIKHVFIINHLTDYNDVINNASLIKETFPKLWVGVNILDMQPSVSLKIDLPFDGIWIDKTLTLTDVENKIFKGDIFSGLNFKYQKQFSGKDLEDQIQIIKQTSTIACTSGAGTGKEASIEKIKNIKELLGDFPLALASGVSSNNIENYLPYVDNFLVASSITDNNEIIKDFLLKDLVSKITV